MALFTKFLVAAGIISALSQHSAEAQVIRPSTDEQKAISFMQERGVHHFLMVNKQQGQVRFVINNQITETAPALVGKTRGDYSQNSLGVTPSGIFKLERLGESLSVGFKKVAGTNLYYTIHPVIDAAGQNRYERLEAENPEQMRISSGCVNVSEDTVGKILGLLSITQVFKDSKSNKQASGSFVVILPDTRPVQSIFKFPEISSP